MMSIAGVFHDRLLQKADNIKQHTASIFVVQKTESSKEFINAFFFHQAAEIKEMNHLSSPVARVVGILPEIYTGTWQNFDLSGSSNFLFQKQMGICTIFKEITEAFSMHIDMSAVHPFFNRVLFEKRCQALGYWYNTEYSKSGRGCRHKY